MKPYFEKMNDLGKAMTEQQIKNAEENVKQIKEVEKTIAGAVEKVKKAGLATEELNKRGEMTVYQRLEYLLDPGTWCPLHTLFDPMDEESGTTGVVDGLGRISGKWAVIIGFDNKVIAGAWIAGQAENILRVTDISKRLHIPLVWLVNCSGVKLPEQEKVYANRRGSGTTPKGLFDEQGAELVIEATRKFKAVPPGRVEIHYDSTGFFKAVFEKEEGVLDALKEYMKYILAYDFDETLARLTDNSEHMEFRPGYGPEVYTGLVKIDGFLLGIIGNRQGFLPKGYPEYAPYPGVGGKLYRQGLIKMNEFVTQCGRDRVPIIWLQDTTGIDVGDIAEKAELLGLGQSLIYSIEQTDVPQICIVLRKGTAAAHYIMGGPTANNHNAFTLGTPTTEIYVMHGETAAAASFARRLVKEKDSGRPLAPVIEKMNALD